jgi:hypothetical protein
MSLSIFDNGMMVYIPEFSHCQTGWTFSPSSVLEVGLVENTDYIAAAKPRYQSTCSSLAL